MVDWADVTSKPAVFEWRTGTTIREPRALVVLGGHQVGKTVVLAAQRQSRAAVIGREGFGGRFDRRD